MTENESSAQKRTGPELDSLSTTPPLLEGIGPDELPRSVLLDIMDVCEDADLPVRGISICHDRSGDD